MTAPKVTIRGPLARVLWDPISRRAWDELPPEVCFYGGAGTGKSMGLMLILIMLMTADDIGGLRVLWCRKTRKSITHSSIVTWSKAMRLLGLTMPSKPKPEQRQVEEFRTAAGVNSLTWASLEDPYSAFSAEYDIVVYEEALQISETVYELAGPRCLRNFAIPWQGLISLTNPGPKTGWLYRRMFVTRRMQPEKTTIFDNPGFYDLAKRAFTVAGAKYLKSLRHMYTSATMIARMIRGDFASEEGWALDNFDETRHVVEAQWVDAAYSAPRLIFPDGHPLFGQEVDIAWTFGSFDLGFVNPASLQSWGMTKTGHLFLLEECYRPGKDRSFWTAEMVRMARKYHWECVVADHDPEFHAHLNASLDEEVLADLNVRGNDPFVRRCEKTAGAKDALKVNVARHLLDNGPDGYPRCFFLADSRRHTPDESLVAMGRPTSLLTEIPHLVWKPLDDAERDDKQAKEELHPGRANHGFDAFVYAGRYVRSRDMTEDWEDGKPEHYPGSFEHHKAILKETAWNTDY